MGGVIFFFVIFAVMNYITFFTEDNKSGLKTKELYISVSYPDMYANILSYIKGSWYQELSFKEKIWYFMNGITDKVSCYHCSADVKFKGTLTKGYGKFCSLSCANDSGMLNKLQSDAIMNKYGVTSTNKLESVKEKKRIAYIDKYGVDNPMKSDIVKSKLVDTMLNKYGVDNSMKLKDVKEKVIDTCMVKYGCYNPFQSEEIKFKIRQTNNDRLGVDYPTQSDSVKTKIRDIASDKLKGKHPFILEVSGNNLKCQCDNCSDTYEISRILFNERVREGYSLCTQCNPIGINSISEAEKEIAEFIKSLGVDIIENDTDVLSGKELDILIPSHGIAIEYDGLYWHSELYKDNNYHLSKTELCEAKGIRLVHIFEDEWIYKKDIVKSRLKNILGITENKIYARKCEIKHVGSDECRRFLDDNHIQGFSKSNIKLGLYYNDELVSLMTFGHGRVIMGGKSDEWELVRFCNKLDTNVIGGASRLLKAFIKENSPKNIISYADRRWSQGELYATLGFDFIHNSKPNYWYIINDIREYRFKYRKSELVKSGFDSGLSEHQIMLSNKRYRIYDCGNMKFSLSIYKK